MDRPGSQHNHSPNKGYTHMESHHRPHSQASRMHSAQHRDPLAPDTDTPRHQPLVLALQASARSPAARQWSLQSKRRSEKPTEGWSPHMEQVCQRYRRWTAVPLKMPRLAVWMAGQLEWPRRCGNAHFRHLQGCRSAGNTADYSSSFASPCHVARDAHERHDTDPTRITSVAAYAPMYALGAHYS